MLAVRPRPAPPVRLMAARPCPPQVARFLKERCRAGHRVLLSTEGPYSNVIKVGGCAWVGPGLLCCWLAACTNRLPAWPAQRRAAGQAGPS